MPTLSSTGASRERAPAALVTSHSPEFSLLLACCRFGNGSEAEAGEFLSRSVIPHIASWDRVFALGEHHGVLPALHQALCGKSANGEGLADAVPRAVRLELERRFAYLTRKNLRLAAELLHVLDCLNAAGVAAIPHKGPVLAEAVYGDLALREFSDLDVLVPASDVPSAKEALARIGYIPNIALSPAEERAYLASGYEYTFDGPAGKNLLEIQWNFVPRFFAVAFDMEAVFARARPGTVAGRAVRTLAAEDLFLAVCVHAAKHLWGRLCWLRDIATTMERVPLDWERVQAESRRLGVGRMVAVSVALARTLLGATVASARGPVSTRICKGSAGAEGDAQLNRIVAAMAQHIPNAEEYNAESMDYFRWMLRLRERFRDRGRFASRLLLTPSLGEWACVKLPEALFPLYRGVRLVRVGGRVLGLRSGMRGG